MCKLFSVAVNFRPRLIIFIIQIKQMDNKTTKFWALHFGILEMMQKGLTLAKASTLFVGEQMEAATYFDSYLNAQAHGK
jgi:hypothetical protein